MIVFLGQIVVLILVLKLCWDITLYFFSRNSFRNQGIPGPTEFPYFGTHTITMIIKGFARMDEQLIKKYGPFVALKEGKTDQLLVSNIEFFKKVWVKESEYFQERRTFDLDDKLIDRMLTSVKGETWKRLRTVMSPAFSTGKLKIMSKNILRCSQTLVESLLNGQEQGRPIDIKRYSECFAMDVIAAVGFGLEISSLKDPNNDFVKHAAVSTVNLRILFLAFFPRLAVILNRFFGFDCGFVKRESAEFFTKLINDIICKTKSSDKDNSEATNFIHLMIKANTENWSGTEDLKISDDEIVSQAVLFFLAGLNTTSDALSFVLYNLAIHQQCQDQVREEMRDICGNDNVVKYEKIQALTYLDCVIEETLRLYPTGGYRLERKATYNTTISGISIKKGDMILAPIFQLGRDPELWDNPEDFRPERFMEDDRLSSNILAFGLGPRACVARRFALLEIKCAVYQIVSKLKVKLHPKMSKKKMEFQKNFFVRPVNKFLLEFQPL